MAGRKVQILSSRWWVLWRHGLYLISEQLGVVYGRRWTAYSVTLWWREGRPVGAMTICCHSELSSVQCLCKGPPCLFLKIYFDMITSFSAVYIWSWTTAHRDTRNRYQWRHSWRSKNKQVLRKTLSRQYYSTIIGRTCLFFSRALVKLRSDY